MKWKEISKDEFFKIMMPLNVHPFIQQGPYPYTSIWKMIHGGKIMGKSIGQVKGPNKYFLPKLEADNVA